MSRWGTLEAEFHGCRASLQYVQQEVPTGSESGARAGHRDGVVHVDGRLRDVSDMETSPAVLTWFCMFCEWSDTASLMWEVDDGPRYRYEYVNGSLTKLRGVLDL